MRYLQVERNKQLMGEGHAEFTYLNQNYYPISAGSIMS